MSAPIVLPALKQRPSPNQSSRHGTKVDLLDPRHGMVAGYNSGCRCPACSEAKREYMRQWRAAHPENSREQSARYRARNPEEKRQATRRYWQAAKEARQVLIVAEATRRGGVCEEPGCSVVAPLHWHHIEPIAKSFWIAASAHHTEAALITELAKCELLCPLHHKARHKAMAA